jgi:hypothetical protein
MLHRYYIAYSIFNRLEKETVVRESLFYNLGHKISTPNDIVNIQNAIANKLGRSAASNIILDNIFYLGSVKAE